MIKTGILNNDFNHIVKFTVKVDGTESENVRIRWDNVFTNINNLNSSYGLYRCSEENYQNATYENVSTLWTSIGRENYKTLPSTREERLITANLYETIIPELTYYYILTINIIENLHKFFYADIILDFSSNYYTLSEAIYDKYTVTSDAVRSTYVNSDSGIDFSQVSSATNGQGLYINNKKNLADDLSNGSVKYFRGNVNNYVTFAGKLWRIISLHNNNNARLISENSEIKSQNFGSASSGNYLGYTNNDTSITTNDGDSSNLKSQLDDWYATLLDEEFNTYINQNTLFCNDTSGYSYSSGASFAYYSPNSRLLANSSPILSCPDTNQLYGGLYVLPVGTITADEVVYAGGTTNAVNNTFYLNNNTNFWTMTLQGNYIMGCGGDTCGTYYYSVNNLGKVVTNRFCNIVDIRPVIELNYDVLITGNGTIDDPWIVQ